MQLVHYGPARTGPISRETASGTGPTWRTVAEAAEGELVAELVFDMAGKAGRGGSSYIDDMFYSRRDLDSDLDTPDGVRELHAPVLRNWRSDATTVVKAGGAGMWETTKYTAAGFPLGLSRPDIDYNTAINSNDLSAWTTKWTAGTSTYDTAVDWNFDGVVNSNDTSAFTTDWLTFPATGRGVLSRANVQNRFGYAGYRWDTALSLYEVRYRWYNALLAMWISPDPAGYVDGPSRYQYSHGRLISALDPSGLACHSLTQREAMIGTGAALVRPSPIPLPLPPFIFPGLNPTLAQVRDILPCGSFTINSISSCNVTVTFEDTGFPGCLGAELSTPGGPKICAKLREAVPPGSQYTSLCNPECTCQFADFLWGTYSVTGNAAIVTWGCTIRISYSITTSLTGWYGWCVCPAEM